MIKTKVKVGDKYTNRLGEVATVVEYRNAFNVLVVFDECEVKPVLRFEASSLRKSNFKNPYSPRVYGVGFLGEGEFRATYTCKVSGKRTNTVMYAVWSAMLQRCYEPKAQLKHPTYVGCSVDAKWHNFQNFAEWFVRQEGYKDKYELDKDILNKGNKVYSEDSCCLVPRNVNLLFTNSKAVRGNLPIGVQMSGERYRADLNVRNIRRYLGSFDTAMEAFMAYKEAKESHIRDLVEGEYKHLPEFIKRAMINYKVEITD